MNYLGGRGIIDEVLGKKAGMISRDQLAGSLRGADETRARLHERLRRS